MNLINYKNCTVDDLILCINNADNKVILRDFYGCVYANNTECVKYLLESQSWLKEVLQSSLIADMQFYDYDEDERKYKLYLPSEELLDVLCSVVHINFDEPIMCSSGIKDNASYVSSSMRNKNTIIWKYDKIKGKYNEQGLFTVRDLFEQEKILPNYVKYQHVVVDIDELTASDRKKLSTMGNSWFVSYMYHFIHPEHKNWELTIQGFRTGTFQKTKKLGLHKRYLETILKANEASLGTNKINLSGAGIKKMAQELLDKWDDLIKNPNYGRI